MNRIRISDITMKQAAEGFNLSFKEKIELGKLLDKLSVSVIELESIQQAKIDSLRIKSVGAQTVNSFRRNSNQLAGFNDLRSQSRGCGILRR